MDLKSQILHLLKTSDEFVSGQELCDKFQVSRTAIWKNMNLLKEEGYDIQAVRNKGYLLKETGDVLNEKEIKEFLHTKYMAQEIHYFKETDSTNIRAKALAQQGAGDGTLVVAEKQTEGRGRRGRVWESPEGEAIYMSLILKPQIHPSDASTLTLVMALSLARAFTEIYGFPPEENEVQIKWPNDLVVHKKKVTGILTEMSADMDSVHYLVIGVGINVNNSQMPKEVSEHGTSLFMETGKRERRCKLIARVMECLEEDYETFLKSSDISLLKDAYESYLVNKGAMVKVLDPKGGYIAKAKGIDAKGQLIVERNGEEIPVYAGEVSVRGIYGYV